MATPADSTATGLVPMAATRAVLVHAATHRGLDGRDGTNRCRTRGNQLGVDDDIEAMFAWIADRAASPKTARDFLSQARRLLWWALERCPNPDSPRHVGKALSSLTRADLMAYRAFLKNPDRRACGPKAPFADRDGNVNPRWRPVEGRLTEAHIEHVFAVLKNLFRYLTDVGYLDGNPLAGARTREKGSMGEHSKRRPTPTARALDAEQWLAVLKAVESLPRDTEKQRRYYERTRFLTQLFFHLGARIGELASHDMQHFVRKGNRWVWSVMGKGGKEAEVPVNESLLAALMRYRVHQGLSPVPSPGEPIPLLADLRGRHRLGERQIARLVKEIFARAAKSLKAQNPSKANVLARASPHWIRHATASFTAAAARNMGEVMAIRALLRHSRLATTMEYVHASDEAMQAVTDRLARLVDESALYRE